MFFCTSKNFTARSCYFDIGNRHYGYCGHPCSSRSWHSPCTSGRAVKSSGGVLIILFKPFKIGDLINAQDEVGVVKEIKIFTTDIVTPDNKRVVIPNGALANNNIVNFSAEGKLRVDLIIGVGYEENIKQTKSVLLNALKNYPDVL